MSDVMFAASGVGCRFGGVVALDDISLAVRAGEIYGIIGPNGAGKTTLFNLITGVYPPTAGEIQVAGTRITGWRPDRIAHFGVARTYQNIRLFRSMTVRQHVLVAQTVRQVRGLDWLRPMRRVETAAAAQAEEILRLCGLWERRDERATALPYGLQRRVEIARAVAIAPRLLLLDEPAAGLNDVESAELARLVAELRRRGLTILVIEHDMPFVMGLCDRMVVLNFGRKLAEGSADAVRQNPAVQEAYLGREEDADAAS